MIAAAGSGERLGAGGPKAFVELAGRPLLAHSLAAAAAAPSIEAIVVAAPPGALDRASEVAAGLGGIPIEVIAGGATRAESVAAALEHVRSELVLVHDAARPLAPPELYESIVARLRAEPDLAAVIAAVPVTDTIKRVAGEGMRITETVPREHLWGAQTPQGFRVAALREAQHEALAAGALAAATDEAALIEAAGGTVGIEPVPGPNLKVTSGEDLLIAEALLGALG